MGDDVRLLRSQRLPQTTPTLQLKPTECSGIFFKTRGRQAQSQAERRQSILYLLKDIQLLTKRLYAIVEAAIRGIEQEEEGNAGHDLANKLHVAVVELMAQYTRYTCDQMMEKLPRELRDRVLEELLLVNDDYYIPLMYQPHTELFFRNPERLPKGLRYPQVITHKELCKRIKVFTDNWRDTELPHPGHYRSPVFRFPIMHTSPDLLAILQHYGAFGLEEAYVRNFTDMELLGDTLHRELIQLWLGRATFRFPTTTTQYLRDFLTRDIWDHQLAVVPYTHLRNIVLELDIQVPFVDYQLRDVAKQISWVKKLTQPTAVVWIQITPKCTCIFGPPPVCDYDVVLEGISSAIKDTIRSDRVSFHFTCFQVDHPEVTNWPERYPAPLSYGNKWEPLLRQINTCKDEWSLSWSRVRERQRAREVKVDEEPKKISEEDLAHFARLMSASARRKKRARSE